ncbi:uncharacterized protein LOC115470284 isoform X3 [Microcaecilia unicolor]|uniref:Uncharacterized protein LOC115470284 isoform X3 n=1 Tax=Microcaecilia unicolor TaxID=1415580 RepID=A0A6P7Y8N5_9AMPH|nr:uncharacterized protein LOC115470284 isoform X3 [Microcaecilia unicolor]
MATKGRRRQKPEEKECQQGPGGTPCNVELSVSDHADISDYSAEVRLSSSNQSSEVTHEPDDAQQNLGHTQDHAINQAGNVGGQSQCSNVQVENRCRQPGQNQNQTDIINKGGNDGGQYYQQSQHSQVPAENTCKQPGQSQTDVIKKGDNDGVQSQCSKVPVENPCKQPGQNQHQNQNPNHPVSECQNWGSSSSSKSGVHYEDDQKQCPGTGKK